MAGDILHFAQAFFFGTPRRPTLRFIFREPEHGAIDAKF